MMESIRKWLDSRKTKCMLLGVSIVTGTGVACLVASGGDPEKFQGLLGAAEPYVNKAVGLAGAGVLGFGMADIGKEKAKIEAEAAKKKK